MNNGISFSARPSDTLPKGNFGGMPSEVIAMARQMGLKAEDMKQVNSMWKNMDDLAESVDFALFLQFVHVYHLFILFFFCFQFFCMPGSRVI